MTVVAAQLPGLAFRREPRAPEPTPLRSDVAGFAGRARRGPVGERVRVEGWKEYQRIFGGLAVDALMPYSIRGYFENGGQVAHVVRVARRKDVVAASGELPLQHMVPGGVATASTPIPVSGYRLHASTPGTWANRTRIHARYRRRGRSGQAEMDLAIEAPGEPPEYVVGLQLQAPAADDVALQLLRRSTLLRLQPLPAIAPASQGPSQLQWKVVLSGGQDAHDHAGEAYADALRWLLDEPEVALLSLPDLYRDFTLPGATLADLLARVRPVLAELLAQVDAARDRLLLLDAPHDPPTGTPLDGDGLLAWLASLRQDPLATGPAFRSAAAYHPWLRVDDPLGGITEPLRDVPPSGHVAGVISRLDRERGAHHTPANASVDDAVDLQATLAEDELLRLHQNAVNLIRCSAGQGLRLWGGSTLARVPELAPVTETADGFLACRRLVHRLVRAIRRVAEPLVFDTNGPEVWLALVRATTTVLLEAWRAGGLQGARAEEAFYVRCDDTTNPTDQRELGRCICEIGIAPVAPMEFIVFRVALGGEGALEVFES
jgi:hypothetical protein